MKRKNWIFGIGMLIVFISCSKEYSLENSGNNDTNGLIVGADCRMSKIIYKVDTGTKKGIGSIEAIINNLDVVTKVTKFDSLSATIEYSEITVIANDTIYINADEYFIVDINKRIIKLHGLTDQTDPFSPQFDGNYFYNANGYLTTKFYTLTGTAILFYKVDYTHIGGNLTHMTATNMLTGDFDMDADISYYSNIFPKRFLYLFPDERAAYSFYNQFYNFGARPTNAVKDMVVRNYDPGNVLRDSTVSAFSNYIMSRDTYVLSVLMTGDDQISIPASAGRLSFYYKCK